MPELVLGDDPYGALLDDLVASACGSEVSPRAARLGWSEAAMARPDIDGVVFALPPGDRRFGWDYPALRDHADALGLPALVLHGDAHGDADAMSGMVAAFVATLDTKGAV